MHYGPPSDQTPTREELFIYADLGSSIAAIVDSPHNAAAPPAQPDMPSTAYNVGYDGIDHPLWLSRHTGLLYTELDTVGNVRRLHADSLLHADGFTGDLGGYSYSAFGESNCAVRAWRAAGPECVAAVPVAGKAADCG